MSEYGELVKRLNHETAPKQGDDALAAQAIERLEREIAKLQESEKAADRLAIEAWDRTAKLEEQLADARAALLFYATLENWAHIEAVMNSTLEFHHGPVDLKAPAGKALGPALRDHGERAREMLLLSREALAAPAPGKDSEGKE